MKNIFKFLVVILSLIFTVNTSFAISTGKIEKLIKNSEMNDSATIAVSIKNVQTGNVVFEQNSNKLLHPASTLKIFTTYAAIDTLGYDYFFKTGFYKDSENNLYIKLGADPKLTSAQLRQALQKVKSEAGNNFKNLYFDDSIIDKKEFADGWIWDDEVSPYTPKVSSYNLDGNIVKINMKKNAQGLMDLEIKPNCPMSVVSYIKSGAKQDALNISRYPWANPDVVEIYGFVKGPVTISVPVSSPRRYFIYNVEKIFDDLNIKISNTAYSSKITPENATLITEIANPVKSVIPSILQNSNNLMSESLCKVAASRKYAATGTSAYASKLFGEFYKNNDISTDGIVIEDASGVSRKNLVSVDWMTDTLNKLYKKKDFEQFKENMSQTGDGTLSKRLYDLRGEAWLKTGSLSNVSAISGYIKSQDGNTYSIAIIEQGFINKQSDVKDFEDELIKLIYSR